MRGTVERGEVIEAITTKTWRAFEVIVKTLVFTLSEMGSPWRVLKREVTSSDLHRNRTTLGTGLR